MKRRLFFKTMVIITAGIAILGVKKSEVEAGRSGTEFLLQHSYVAEYHDHSVEEVLEGLHIGDNVVLQREPTNPFDYKSVAVLWKNKKLGYLPRLENTTVYQLMDRGVKVSGKVAKIEKNAVPWQRVGVEIYLIQDRRSV